MRMITKFSDLFGLKCYAVGATEDVAFKADCS